MRPKALWTNGQYWDSPTQISAHHYARCLVARGWDVAFVSDPISPLHFLKPSSLRETRDRLSTWLHGGLRDINNHLFYYTPFVLAPHYDAPLLRSRWLLDHWHTLAVPRLLRILRANGFGEIDLLVADSIAQSFWLDLLQPRQSIMRIADDLSGFRGVSPAMLTREREMIHRVDHVVYTARQLESHILDCRPKAMTHVPNGVDLNHFHSVYAEPPIEYNHIPAPRAVYVGAIEHWFDGDLLADVAARLPAVSFVVIGPQRIPLPQLARLPNVHLLGRRPYTAIPAYLRNAAVGLIPFRITPMVHSVHPIKLYEYLACGLPVVSVPWQELASLNSPALLCPSAPTFADAIARSIANPPPRQDLIAAASTADWRSRFELIASALHLP